METWKIRTLDSKDFRVLINAAFIMILSIAILYIALIIAEHYIIFKHNKTGPIKKALVYHKIKYPYIAYHKIEQPKPEPEIIEAPDPEPKNPPEIPFSDQITKGTAPNSVIVNDGIEIFYKEIQKVLNETPQGFK